MVPNVKPALDPLAHRAAIQALEAQRAAYRRFAATAAAQQQALGTGDGEQAGRAADVVQRGFEELDAGARQLGPLVAAVHADGNADQLQELQRSMTELLRDARRAETAIQTLTAQLEAWRDAYGRQLAEQGLAPGGAPSDAGSEPAAAAGTVGYGARYRARGAGAARGVPSLLDRKG